MRDMVTPTIRGAEKRAKNKDKDGDWVIALRQGKRRQLRERGTEIGRLTDKIEPLKGQIRAKVEPSFFWLKVRFGHRKVRYCDLAKNTAQLYNLFALANQFY